MTTDTPLPDQSFRDQSPVAMLSLSAEGAVTGWGERAQRLLGYSTNEVLGLAFPSLAREPSHVEHALDRLRRSGSLHSACFTTHLKGKDARDAPAFLCLDALRDAEGNVEGFLVSARDARTVAFETPHDAPRGRLAVPDPGALSGLTPRQRLVLELIARGYSTREIAKRLNRSVKTIETHRAQLMKRLNIYHVPGLVGFAIRAGLVTIE